MTQELNLVEFVRRSNELTHLEVHLYLCFCAYRDEATGISKPKNFELEAQTRIDRSTISKAKGSLAAKFWIELLGGRRVRPLVGYGPKNGTDANFSGEESVATPKNPPAKNGRQANSRPQTNFSEGSADAENGTEANFSGSKNGTDVHYGTDVHMSPRPPIRNKYNSANNSLLAGRQADDSSENEVDLSAEFFERYGRQPDDLCDKAFVEAMKRHPEFTGVDVAAVWTDMGVKAKKPKTCYRFWRWLLQEKRKLERGNSGGRDQDKAGNGQAPDRRRAGAEGAVPRRAGRDVWEGTKIIS
jgi:hypothetical protein